MRRITVSFTIALGAFLVVQPAISQTAPLPQSECIVHLPTASVCPPGLEGGQLVPAWGDHVYLNLEAEQFRAPGTYPQHEWVASPMAYPDKYPNRDFIGDACGDRSSNVSGNWAIVWPGSGTDTIYTFVTIAKKNPYRIWIRYQEVPDLPAPAVLEFYALERISTRDPGRFLGKLDFGTGRDVPKGMGAGIVWKSVTVEFPAGLVKVVLKKGSDTQPAAMRAVDFVFLTTDVNYFPSGTVLLPDRTVLQERIRDLDLEGKPLAIWRSNCWANVASKSWPNKKELTDHHAITACVNEREQTLLGLTDLTGRLNAVTVTTRLFGVGSKPVSEKLKLYRLSFTKSRRYGWVPDALFPIENGKVFVAPYHTAWVWAQVDTWAVPSGDYQGEIVVSQNQQILNRIILKVKVLPVRLPERWPIDALTWVRTIDNPFTDPANVRVLTEHGITSLTGGLLGGPNAEPQGIDAAVMKKYDLRQILVGINPPYDRQSVSALVAKLKNLGVDYERWSVYLEDEPDDQGVGRRVEKAKAIRQIDPRIRFYANPGWHKAATLDTFRQLAPWVDLWCPYIGHLSDPATLSFLKSTGKPISYYKCDGFLSRNPTMAYNYFRKFPWVALKYDIAGCGFWSVNGSYEDPWTDLDAPGADGDGCDPAIVYPGSPGQGFITTRNLQGFREGMEDVKCLILLKNKIPREEFDDFVDRMLSSDGPDQVESIHRDLLARLAGM